MWLVRVDHRWVGSHFLQLQLVRPHAGFGLDGSLWLYERGHVSSSDHCLLLLLLCVYHPIVLVGQPWGLSAVPTAPGVCGYRHGRGLHHLTLVVVVKVLCVFGAVVRVVSGARERLVVEGV